MKPKQSLTITLEYETEHVPDSPSHLHEVARHYFEGKGITLEGGVMKI
jgi:hypothetical protein